MKRKAYLRCGNILSPDCSEYTFWRQGPTSHHSSSTVVEHMLLEGVLVRDKVCQRGTRSNALPAIRRTNRGIRGQITLSIHTQDITHDAQQPALEANRPRQGCTARSRPTCSSRSVWCVNGGGMHLSMDKRSTFYIAILRLKFEIFGADRKEIG